MHALSIGKLAKAANVSIHTIRFYEKSGLLPQPTRRPSGFREYSDLDLLQLQFVRQARELGFSLEDIADLLALRDATTDGAALAESVDRKLAIVERKIAQLEHWRQALRSVLTASEGQLSRRCFLLHFSTSDTDIEPELAPFEPRRPS